MDAVVEGLFDITQSLYGLEYQRHHRARPRPLGQQLWHPDVKLLRGL